MRNPLDPKPDEPEFFLYHRGGPWLRATFKCANDALAWQEGNRGRPYAYMFFVTDENGDEVVLQDQKRRPGHAYAILAALEKRNAGRGEADGLRPDRASRAQASEGGTG